MFFEPGAIDEFRHNLSQQSTWGALKLSTKLPGLGVEHNSSHHNRHGSGPETKSVYVQTEGPPGSSDVRPSSKAARSCSAGVSTTGSNNVSSSLLGVIGSSKIPPGRKKKISVGPAKGLDGLFPDSDGDDASLGTMALSIDSLTISDQHSTVADTESYAFDANSSVQSGSVPFDDDDQSRGSKSTVSGYLPSIKSSVTEGLPVRFKYRGPSVKHFGASSSSTATTMHNLAVNHKAFQSRMAELESWREQRMSKDKSKAREAAAAMGFVGANGLATRIQGLGSNRDLVQPSSAASSAADAALIPSAPNSNHSSTRSKRSRKGSKELISRQFKSEMDDGSLGSSSLASTL